MVDDKTTKRRRPTERELAIWRSLIETTNDLGRILGAQLQASGLSSADYQVLLALKEADGKCLRSSALAATIGWEPSRLSHHLGRMERRSLIRRDECPTDSRGAEVSLTDSGLSAFLRASVPHLRVIKKIFVDALTSEQLEALADIMQSLQSHLQEEENNHHDGGTHR
jgi:DNA-binding MarR family transcriptional regulator